MIAIHISLFVLDYCAKKEENRSDLKSKIPEILIILYSTMGLTAVLVFSLAIMLMPTNSAFPFSYAYKAYLNNSVSKSTMVLAFILEVIFIASFAGKLTWFFAYTQIYMVVFCSCSKILRYLLIKFVFQN